MSVVGSLQSEIQALCRTHTFRMNAHTSNQNVVLPVDAVESIGWEQDRSHENSSEVTHVVIKRDPVSGEGMRMCFTIMNIRLTGQS